MKMGGEKRLRKEKSEERARRAVPLRWKLRVVPLDLGGVEEGL
jgi:hypothetical protein